MEIFTYENLFLVFFIIILIIGIHAIKKLHQKPLKQFELAIMYLGGISVLLVSINIYLNIQSQNKIEKNRRAYNTVKNVQRIYLAPQKELVDFFPEGFSLYQSINPSIDFENYVPSTYNPAKKSLVDLYGSIRIFQAMEDFVSTSRLENTEYIYTWLNVFLFWMQSPILRTYWQDMSPSFAAHTRNLVDSMIKGSDKLITLQKKKGTLTRQDYDNISKPLAIQFGQT
jgi:hypothetical protein